MSKVYCAVNGDQVGAKIAEKIKSNDPESVRQASADFNAAHAEMDRWVESVGGRVISASGDEAIYELDDSQLGQMESLIDKYSSKTGHTLTVGVGADMLQSVKAMTYGKMHDPGQIIEYDQEVENGLAPQEEAEAEQIAGDEEGQGEQPEHEQGLSPEDNMAHDAEEQEDDEQDPDNIEADEESGEFGGNTEPVDGDVEQDVGEDLENQAIDQEGEEGEEDLESPEGDVNLDQPQDGEEDEFQEGQDLPEEEDDLDPAHEQNLNPEQDFVGDAEEQEDDEQDADNIEADEEPAAFGGNTEPMDDDLNEDVNEDINSQDQDQAAQGKSPILDMIHANSDESEDQEFGGQEEDNMQGNNQEFGGEEEEGFDDGSEDPSLQGDDQELSPDEMANPNAMQDPNAMQGDDQMDDGSMGDQAGGDLKTRVAQTLQNFTANKDKINAMQQTDPEMYKSVIEMINRMIEMAKQFNAAPGQEDQDQEMGMEEDQEFGEEDPNAELSEEGEDGDPNAEFGEEEEEEPAAPAKKPAFGNKPAPEGKKPEAKKPEAKKPAPGQAPEKKPAPKGFPSKK